MFLQQTNYVLILAFTVTKQVIFQSENLELGSFCIVYMYNNLAHYDHFFFLKNYSTLLFIDLVGPVYLSKKSYTRMPVMIDRSTRWAQVSLVKILNSKAVLNSFTFTWVARYGGVTAQITNSSAWTRKNMNIHPTVHIIEPSEVFSCSRQSAT